MINYLLLTISTLMATGKGVFCKVIGNEGETKKEKAYLNFKSFFVAFLCSLIFIIDRIPKLFEISAFSFVLSIFFGLSLALTQIFHTQALGRGPVSTVTLIYACGFLVPIFYGLMFLEEMVSPFQWAGIVLLICSLILCVSKKEEKRALISWIPFALIAMLGSGANAIFQKVHRFSAYADEMSYFPVCCMFFSTVFTGIVYLITKKDGNPQEINLKSKRVVFKRFMLPVCLGACTGFLNFSNLFLSGKLLSVIHFPIYNVGSMLLISIISALIYKEKPSKTQIYGFLLGIIAILIIGLL